MADITCELNKLLCNYEVAMDERDELRDAVRNLRNVQGRHHTQIAVERLIALLPDADGEAPPSPAAKLADP